MWQSIDIMYIWKFEFRLCGNNLGHLAIHNTTKPSVILFSPIFIQPSISHSIVDISLPSTLYIYIIVGGGEALRTLQGTLWTSISKLLQEIESTMRLSRQSITNRKVWTICKESMFVRSGGFGKCRVGIRKWLKTR